MMSEKDYIEYKFIQQELKRWGFELKEIMIRTIVEKDIVSRRADGAEWATQHLRDRIKFNVFSEGDKGGKLTLMFPNYGRWIEIKYRKSKSRSKLSSRVDTNELLYGVKSRKKRGYKDMSWYNISVYGSLSNLTGRLMFGLTEAVRLDLRKHIMGSVLPNGDFIPIK